MTPTTVFHGTSINEALKIMQGKFKKDPVMTSLGYAFNVTDDRGEALVHAGLKKRDASPMKGALLEFSLQKGRTKHLTGLLSDQKLYDMAQTESLDMIDIDLTKTPEGFHVVCIYNPKLLSHPRIVEVV